MSDKIIFCFQEHITNELVKMLKYWNICVMLDYCDIGYTEKQVMKLEKLLNTFLKKYLIKIEPELINADKEIVEILRKEKEFDVSNEDESLQIKKCENFENVTLIESENTDETFVKQEDFEEYENDNCQLTNVFGIDYKSERKEYDEKYPDKKYPCEICQKQCRGLKGLKTHIQTEHRDIAYFVCSICDLGFLSKPIMEMHQELTHNCTPMEVETIKKQCVLCEQSFFGKKILSHMKNCEKTAEEMKNGCPKCGKVYSVVGKYARQSWKYHVKQCKFVENQKSILCEFCGKSCAGKQANKDHMIEFHSGDFFQLKDISLIY